MDTLNVRIKVCIYPGANLWEEGWAQNALLGQYKSEVIHITCHQQHLSFFSWYKLEKMTL